jgi:hypothetical protein
MPGLTFEYKTSLKSLVVYEKSSLFCLANRDEGIRVLKHRQLKIWRFVIEKLLSRMEPCLNP